MTTPAPPPSSPMAIAPTPEALGRDGAPALHRLEWKVGSVQQALSVTAEELVLQTGTAAPRHFPVDQVAHISARRWRPLAHLVAAAFLGALAFAAPAENPQWLTAAVVGCMAVLFLMLTSMRFGDLRLTVGGTTNIWRLKAGQWNTAQAVVAHVTRVVPKAARVPLSFTNLIAGAAVDLVAPRAVVLRRMREKTGEAVEAGQEDRAVTLSRRIAAWNLLFSAGFPLLVMGAWWARSNADNVSNILGLLALPPLSILGLVLQARLLPLGKRWIERP